MAIMVIMLVMIDHRSVLLSSMRLVDVLSCNDNDNDNDNGNGRDKDSNRNDELTIKVRSGLFSNLRSKQPPIVA